MSVVCGRCAKFGVDSTVSTVPVPEPHPTPAGDWLAELHDTPRPVVTHQWVCQHGHVIGVMMDVGHLDLGLTSGPDL